MADHIWYIGAEADLSNARGFDPDLPPDLDRRARFRATARPNAMAERGEVVDPDDLPEVYVRIRTVPSRSMDVPLWLGKFVFVRDDVVEILRAFDLGTTVIKPIRIEQGGRAGTLEGFNTLLTSNVRPTIDPDASEPLPHGFDFRPHLLTDTKGVHPRVVAFSNAGEGPALWCDPAVYGTLFTSAELGAALGGAPFGKKLKMKKVRLGERIAVRGQ